MIHRATTPVPQKIASDLATPAKVPAMGEPTAGSNAVMRGNHDVSPDAPFKVLDLFSGAGGLSQGLHEASHFKVMRAVEMDTAAAATYRKNFGEVAYSGSIETWLANEDVPRVDLVVGGPPCQGFSTLGKQDAEDIRNMLWREYMDTVVKAEPSYFVLENVPAFARSAQYALFKEATSTGEPLAAYNFESYLLNAADFGAAQLRRRLVVIGHHRDLPNPGPPVATHEGKHVSLRRVLRGITPHIDERHIDLPARPARGNGRSLPGPFRTDELHVTRHYTPVSRQRFAHIPAGGNRTHIPWDLLSPCWQKHTSGSFDVMGRLHWDRPSVTIRTEFFKPEKGRYLHPDEHRAITHHEAARIQGFPDDFKWFGSKTSIARQIGNAVPVPLAKAIGLHLAEALGGGRNLVETTPPRGQMMIDLGQALVGVSA